MYGPVDDIIPRKPDPKVKDLVDKLNIVINQFVDFGSNVLKWDTEVKRVEAFNTPIMMSFRHFLELADSVSILIKHSSVDPCKLLLRGMLETYFGMEYMLETDTERRGMAFLVWHIHKQIKDDMRSDAGSPMGKELRAKLKKDKYTSRINLPDDPNAKERVEKKNKLLQESTYQNAESEYQRLRTAGENNPEWYRLYGGQKDLEQMTNKLNLMGIYDLLYRKWSGPTHGNDIITGKASLAADGSAEILQIRLFNDVQEAASWALTLSLMMFRLYIDKRIPERRVDYAAWYSTVEKHYVRITSREPLIMVN